MTHQDIPLTGTHWRFKSLEKTDSPLFVVWLANSRSVYYAQIGSRLNRENTTRRPLEEFLAEFEPA